MSVEAVAPRVAPATVETPSNAVAPMLRFSPTGRPLLSGIQSELYPGTLWHSVADQVSVFGDLARIGLGAPAFLAYSSPTGIAVVRPGGVMIGDQMRENWLLAGFSGAAGWTEWDSPWAVFLQSRPRHVALETNQVTLAFDGPAGFWTMMPLYGTYLPPVQGREILKAQGLKEKGLLTWEWPLVVARDPLTRLRYWAGATRRFPERVGGGVEVNGSLGTVTLRERFKWFEIPDAWSTRPVEIAPVSPVLGLVLTRGQSFPVKLTKAPFDLEMPTVYGPSFGVPDTSVYAMAFSVLRYINDAERVIPLDSGKPSARVAETIERLRLAGREMFPSANEYQPEGGGDWISLAALYGYLWQARALEFFDDATRTNAVASLRRAMWERVLTPERFVERDVRGENGRVIRSRESQGPLGRAWTSALVQAMWAVAHATGDRDLVRERWPLVRQAWVRHVAGWWIGFGTCESATLGDGVAPNLAWARLAWLAGDLESYRLGCGAAARELVLLHARLRGGKWFREQQPWRPGPPMPDTVAPQRLLGETAGWEVAGPGYPAGTSNGWPGERWTRFVDWDVARFCRDHLAADVRREVGWIGPTTGSAVSEGQGVAGLLEMGFEAPGATNRLSLGNPPLSGNAGSAVLSRCLAILRAEGMFRTERLIPAVNLDGEEATNWESPTNAHRVQTIDVVRSGQPWWPRVRWVDWTTPMGEPWDVGEVRAGNADRPSGVSRVEGVHGLRWDVEAVSTPGG